MKSKVFLILLSGTLLLSSCEYLKKHRLFSKNSDEVLDMTIAEPEPLAADTAIYTKPIEQPVISTPSNDRYFMIVGSFQNSNLARQYSEKIEQMGYNSEVYEAPNGFYRVSAKSYSNFRQGISEIDDFRSSITPGAWLNVRR